MKRNACCWYTALAVALMLATSSSAADKSTEAWKYVGNTTDPAFSRPALQAVRLADEKPDPMSETAAYRGSRRRYAQLRYGTEGSARVIVVVDEISRNEFDLYVDRNRNRVIEQRELIKGTGRYRKTQLNVEIVEGDAARHVPRNVTFRRGITRQSIAFGTDGYAEGRATLAGREVSVRRVDGDGNGFFSNGNDRLWIDFNGDGRWDTISEQLPFLPVLRWKNRRFAVRADRLGTRLRFAEIVGVGRLKVALANLPRKTRLRRFEVMLIGEDGSAFSLSGDKTQITVPVGRYALESVALSILDGKSPDAWNFVFSRTGGDRPKRWYDVGKNQTVNVDPIGTFRFALYTKDDKPTCKPGETLAVQLRLFTGDGLLVNSSTCGDADRYSSEDKHNCAEVRLIAAGKSTVGTARSGFA